jgi:parallel beta-helix repeat protein
MKKLLQSKSLNFLSLKTYFLLSILFVSAVFLSACKKNYSSPCHDENSFSGKGKPIIVHSGGSIQAAVDAAEPGQVISIAAGTYSESIVVNKAGIQIIGSSCYAGDRVIIENPGAAANGITVNAGADGFVLKNVTVQNFKSNGVLLTHVNDFLLSHVAAINNGAYGLFPVFCKNGAIEYCSATGHDDTGIYVGQSDSIAMQYNETYGNVNGLEVENSTGIVVFKNHSYDNVSGILIVLLPGLTIKTASNILVTQNNFENNNHINFGDPADGFEALVPSGTGILNVGADNVTIKNNKISNNNFTGIATVSTLVLGALAGLPPAAFADIEPNPDNTKITNNILVNNGTAPPAGLPLPGVDLLWDGSGTNNCWKNNIHASEYPTPLPACN